LIFAIISDLHANLEAVDACFRRIDEIKPNRIICLGDLVDYCAQPNEVIEIVKRRCVKVILGNHDEAQFHYSLSEGFNGNAKTSSILTRRILLPEHIEYFKQLPRIYSEHGLLFVHSSPAFPEEYKYINSFDSANYNFGHFVERICFTGHSHIPVLFEEQDNKVMIAKPGKLNEKCRYIINVGSVGQPRDGDPRSCFGIFDSENLIFRHERVEYDINAVSQKILALGLPEKLASCLFSGR